MSELKRLHALRAVGFQTGSQRFGCVNPQDDDWVIKGKDWDRIIGTDLGDFFYNSNLYSEADGEFRCFFLKHGIIVYNFIIVNPEEFRVWRQATRLMLKMPVQWIQDKRDRVELFECFKFIIRRKANPEKYGTPPVVHNKLFNNPIGDDIPF